MDFVRKRKSNEARLQAMQDRIKSVESSNSFITAALKGDNISKSHHFTFASDTESENEFNEVLRKKIKSDNIENKHSNIFKETEPNSETEEYKFPDRPQFEGRIGAKLFRLQRRAGNDERFQMDEKFNDSSSDIPDLEVENHDDVIDNDLEEKQTYLKILGEVLGKDVKIEKKQYQVMKDVVRFDPTQESHKKYVLKKDEKVPAKIEEIAMKQSDKLTEEIDPIPKISNQTFYECQDEIPISSLFEYTKNSPEKETALFNFQIQDSDYVPPLLPYESAPIVEGSLPALLDTEQHFAAENDESGKEMINSEETHSDHINSLNLFFFHANNPQLRNRLGEVKFYRNQDLDTLNREWHAKAVSLMQDCKRKHRDAVRWRKKSLSSK